MRDCKIILPVGCNAKCSFCFSKGTKYSKNFVEDVKHSLNRLNESVKANISGGEPTLYPELLPLLKMLKNHPRVSKIILTTNGSKLTDTRWIADYINHLNISRHCWDDEVNNEIFGIEIDADYSTITDYFNRHGVDVRCNCYLSELFRKINDLQWMIEWAADKGFNSIKFRNDFSNGMEMNKWEKMFKQVYKPIYEDSCPVCRISEYLYRIPVFFGYGVPEPSDYEGTFEYVINQDGKLYWDYSCKKPVLDDTLECMNKKFVRKALGCGNTSYSVYKIAEEEYYERNSGYDNSCGDYAYSGCDLVMATAGGGCGSYRRSGC